MHQSSFLLTDIRNCLAQWKTLTQDQWIHQVVEGYLIESPPVDNACPMYEIDKPRLEALDQEILDLYIWIGSEATQEEAIHAEQMGRDMFEVGGALFDRAIDHP